MGSAGGRFCHHSLVAAVSLVPLAVTRAVLSVLLVLRVEVVDSVRHDVARIHRLLEGRRYALHGDRPPHALRRDAALAEVDRDGERVAQGDGSEEHLNTDEKILVARRNGS